MQVLSEAQTRKNKIDPAMVKAGWKLGNRSQVRFEIPVDGENADPWNGITDYSLYHPNGEIIAAVEAKRMPSDWLPTVPHFRMDETTFAQITKVYTISTNTPSIDREKYLYVANIRQCNINF